MTLPYSNRLFLLCILIALITGCSSNNDIDDNLLSQNWTQSAGRYDDEVDETIEKVTNYFYIPIDRLDNLNEKVPSNPGYIWLKNEFTVADSYDIEQAAITLGRISIADKTYLNGVLIGSAGHFPPNYFSAWNLTRLYLIPNNLIKRGKNTLLIKVFVNGEGSVSGKKYLGPYDKAKAIQDKDQFRYSTLSAIMSTIVIMFGFLHLSIFIKRRKDRENLYYSLLCFIFSFNLSNFYIASLPNYDAFPLSYLTYQKIIYSTFSIIVFLGMLFVHTFIGKPVKTRYLLIHIFAVLTPIVIYWFQPNYEAFNMIKGKAQLFLAIPILYTLAIVGLGIFNKVKDIWILLLGLSPLIATSGYDLIVIQILKSPGAVYLSGLGFPVFIFAMALILVNRFVQNINVAEELNISLESKVETRTLELKNANDQLEVINEALTDINHKLETSNKNTARDMKIAVNLQKSLFQSNPPSLDGWDIAFEYKPMSGVSGDFYSFFIEENKFLGVGIFDVSGHGIASGLITMIANTIINRVFMHSLTKPINKVVSDLNSELIREIASVDNYLTGILLRINDDTVEYVNAGHTELLVKRPGSTTKIVQTKNDNFKGHFLGVKEMEAEYKSVSFKIIPGDCLILYTDYIIEATNSKKEEFGLERLALAINSINSDLSARAITSRILKEVEDFTEGKELTDDCTLIVLKKK